MIPPLEKGQEVHVNKLDLLEKETEPPKRYTDATLLTAMKNAGREVEDDELAEAMKESGLGTPATRAEMIEKLIRTRYIERRKKILHPTEKGMALISVVTEPLRSAELTGSWEQQLKDIENGERGASEYYEAIVNFVKETIPLVQRVPRLRISDPRPGDKRPPPKAPAKGGAKQNAPSKPAAPEKKGKIDPRHIGPCPACGQGTILKGNKAYGCSQFRQGCRFLVPIEYKGKALRPKQIHDLLTKGKTSKLIGFKGETGEVCSGKLHLKEGRIEFEALKNRPSASNPKKPEEVTCPQCEKGRIIKGKTAYGCNRFREGCRFMVRFEIAGKKLSESQTRDLLFKGRTRKIKGLKNKEGNKFDARLKLDQGQVKFEFD